jgi:hypothetical protein
MSRFEARLRAAVLVVTTVVSWTMLIGQARQTHALAQVAVSQVQLQDARLAHLATGPACRVR